MRHLLFPALRRAAERKKDSPDWGGGEPHRGALRTFSTVIVGPRWQTPAA
jgi:hypothetical protein